MGGAFVAVADDINATYWNPAGLLSIKPGAVQYTWMHTTTNRDNINYQEYMALATRFIDSKTEGAGSIAFGASFISTQDFFYDTIKNILIRDDERWVWASLAKDMGKAGMLGFNARAVSDSPPTNYRMKSESAYDLSYLNRINDRLSIGLLIQDINQPRKYSKGTPFVQYGRNFRPGIAYKPSRNSVLAFDAYDLSNDSDSYSFRLGGEAVLGRLSLRGGFYGLGGSNGPQAATFGFGLNGKKGSLDMAVMTGDFDNTVLMSGTFKLD